MGLDLHISFKYFLKYAILEDIQKMSMPFGAFNAFFQVSFIEYLPKLYIDISNIVMPSYFKGVGAIGSRYGHVLVNELTPVLWL